MSDGFWQAFFTMLGLALVAYINRTYAKEAATKAVEVKATLAANTAEVKKTAETVAAAATAVASKIEVSQDKVLTVLDGHSDHLNRQDAKVEEIHRATNSIVAQLVDASEDVGARKERDRVSNRNNPPPEVHRG